MQNIQLLLANVLFYFVFTSVGICAAFGPEVVFLSNEALLAQPLSDISENEALKSSEILPLLSHLFIPITSKGNLLAHLAAIRENWRANPPCNLGKMPLTKNQKDSSSNMQISSDVKSKDFILNMNRYIVNIFQEGQVRGSLQYNTTAVFGLFEVPDGTELHEFPIICQQILDEFGECFRKIEFKDMSTHYDGFIEEVKTLRSVHEKLINGELINGPTSNVYVLDPLAQPIRPNWLEILHKAIDKDPRTRLPFFDRFWLSANFAKYIDFDRKMLNPFAMYHLPRAYLVNMSPGSSYGPSFYDTYVRNHVDTIQSRGFHAQGELPVIDLDREFLQSWLPISRQFVHCNYAVELDLNDAYEPKNLAKKYPDICFVLGGVYNEIKP